MIKLEKLDNELNNVEKKVLNKKYNSNKKTRFEIYRHRFDMNGKRLKIEEQEQPLWKKHVEEDLLPLGKIKNINSLNKNEIKKE